DRSKTMVFDLLGDRGENWEKRNGYEQFPWVWCTITNFGGKQFMEGKLMRVLTEPKRASRSSIGSNIKGDGVIPEAIENNEIIYQSILDGAWHLEVPSIQKNISDYTKAIV
ncbi:MAG: alpha-N-acetylglucosaminidase TIM-barrel domain-containing protein, partial [Flavobacterium sp.]